MNIEQIEQCRKGILRFDFLNNEAPKTGSNLKIVNKTDTKIIEFIKNTSNEIVNLVKKKAVWERAEKLIYVFNSYVLEYVLTNNKNLTGYVKIYKFN